MTQDINTLFEVLRKTNRTTGNPNVSATLAFKMNPLEQVPAMSVFRVKPDRELLTILIKGQ
ncbi:hypothetical protein [uncultured Desulfobacter sp.]|uniref:hypothetical protein n=1 Tax=uncultured Desulfobacter sp. TaxID=240139 RepID=UPI0029F56546|nr:hypothetical protein [uncultured Desulfobacter sp.]